MQARRVGLFWLSRSCQVQGQVIDCVYIAVSARDARYTRICVASVRYFYPDIPIRLLVSGRLQRGLADELRQYWNVGTAELPRGEYGWGFVKLEALFAPPGEKFLVLDSDTVLTGQVLETWNEFPASFLVDDEEQSEADTKRLYYDWEKVRKIDPSARPPRFVFNSGQWFGTGGVLTRDDFAPWVEWTMPRTLRHPEHFMPGDQGILNYVLNQKAAIEELLGQPLFESADGFQQDRFGLSNVGWSDGVEIAFGPFAGGGQRPLRGRVLRLRRQGDTHRRDKNRGKTENPNQ